MTEEQRRWLLLHLNNNRGGGTNSGGGETSVLQPWYDSLSVKPSEGLWTDLKIMADGMNSDGDWDEADLVSVHAALETDEQRLRPFKTSSGLDFTLIGTPELSINGFRNPSTGLENLINIKWNPAANGIKYTLTSAYIGAYGRTLNSTQSLGFFIGCISDDYTNGLAMQVRAFSTSFVFGTNSFINDYDVYSISKNLSNTSKSFFISLIRDNDEKGQYLNGSYQEILSLKIGVPNKELLLLSADEAGYYHTDYAGYSRSVIIGSNLIDSDRVAARLNTFFAARGLSIANY